MTGYYCLDPKRGKRERKAEYEVLCALHQVLSGASSITEAAKEYRLDLEKFEETVLRFRVTAMMKLPKKQRKP